MNKKIEDILTNMELCRTQKEWINANIKLRTKCNTNIQDENLNDCKASNRLNQAYNIYGKVIHKEEYSNNPLL